jgi:hypothetical protein
VHIGAGPEAAAGAAAAPATGGCTAGEEGDTDATGLGVTEAGDAEGDAGSVEAVGWAASELPVQVAKPRSTARSTAPTAALRRQ